MKNIITGKEGNGTEIMMNGFAFWVVDHKADGSLIVSNERNNRVELHPSDFKYSYSI